MKIFRILTHAGKPRTPESIIGMLITEDAVSAKAAMAAWSYAIRYSAKGFDLLDYEAAIKLMLQRHPSWRFDRTHFDDVYYNSNEAENDKPD